MVRNPMGPSIKGKVIGYKYSRKKRYFEAVVSKIHDLFRNFITVLNYICRYAYLL